MRVEEVVRKVLEVVRKNVREARGMCISFRPGDVGVRNTMLLHGILKHMESSGLLKRISTSKGSLYLVCRDSPLWKIVEEGKSDIIGVIAK